MKLYTQKVWIKWMSEHFKNIFSDFYWTYFVLTCKYYMQNPLWPRCTKDTAMLELRPFFGLRRYGRNFWKTKPLWFFLDSVFSGSHWVDLWRPLPNWVGLAIKIDNSNVLGKLIANYDHFAKSTNISILLLLLHVW